jgi:hypothetical protein
MKELTVAQLNWEICIANLNDCIKYLEECQRNLDKSLEDLREWRMRETRKKAYISGVVFIEGLKYWHNYYLKDIEGRLDKYFPSVIPVLDNIINKRIEWASQWN